MPYLFTIVVVFFAMIWSDRRLDRKIKIIAKLTDEEIAKLYSRVMEEIKDRGI